MFERPLHLDKPLKLPPKLFSLSAKLPRMYKPAKFSGIISLAKFALIFLHPSSPDRKSLHFFPCGMGQLLKTFCHPMALSGVFTTVNGSAPKSRLLVIVSRAKRTLKLLLFIANDSRRKLFAGNFLEGYPNPILSSDEENFFFGFEQVSAARCYCPQSWGCAFRHSIRINLVKDVCERIIYPAVHWKQGSHFFFWLRSLAWIWMVIKFMPRGNSQNAEINNWKSGKKEMF